MTRIDVAFQAAAKETLLTADSAEHAISGKKLANSKASRFLLMMPAFSSSLGDLGVLGGKFRSPTRATGVK
jgi:hypothetical protein